jgi:circadian clock protein KaiB
MMDPVVVTPPGSLQPSDAPSDGPTVQLSLYIARATPNSVRAEQNLSAVLKSLAAHSAGTTVEIIDVFTQPRRALNDGIVVTPTFVAVSNSRRAVLIGDLSDRDQLQHFLEELMSQ